MYLGCTLLDTGFNLKPGRGIGPDFRVRGPHGELILIEAIAASAGITEDTVPEMEETDEFVEVPTEKIVLRITSAIREKYQRLLELEESTSVPEGAHLVVAVNTGSIQHARWLFNPPISLQAVLPIGNLQLILDRDDPEYRQESYSRRIEIQRSSGRPSVQTGFFLDPAHSVVSGVLHSNASPFSRPRPSGDEFEFVHNPNASAPLALGWFRRGREFWVGADRIESRRWSTDGSDGS